MSFTVFLSFHSFLNSLSIMNHCSINFQGPPVTNYCKLDYSVLESSSLKLLEGLCVLQRFWGAAFLSSSRVSWLLAFTVLWKHHSMLASLCLHQDLTLCLSVSPLLIGMEVIWFRVTPVQYDLCKSPIQTSSHSEILVDMDLEGHH